MHQKAKKNQKFGTSDLVGLIALTGLALTITWTIVQDALRDDRPERAQLGAEALAHQMVAGGFGLIETNEAEDESNPGSREIASAKTETTGGSSTLGLFEGSMGRDPWNNPYRYKLLRSTDGNPVRILVWSQGPNGKSETQVEDFAVASADSQVHFRFGGDDVGYEYKRR